MPAQPPMMFTGFLVILGGLIHPALGQAFGWLAWPFLVWTTGIVEGVAALPYAAFDTGSIPLWLIAAYYLLLIAGAAFIVQPPSRRTQLMSQFKASLPQAPGAPSSAPDGGAVRPNGASPPASRSGAVPL